MTNTDNDIIKKNRDKNADEMYITICEQYFEDLREYRRAEWKVFIYVTIFLLGVFTTLFKLSSNPKYKDTFESIKRSLSSDLNPIHASIIIILLIGLWGFFTILTIKLRFNPVFNYQNNI